LVGWLVGWWVVYSCCYPSIHPSVYVYLWLYSPFLHLGRFFSLLILYTVGRTPLTGDQPVAMPLPTHRTIQTQNKLHQTSIPRVRFEPTIPAFGEIMKAFIIFAERMQSHPSTNINYSNMRAKVYMTKLLDV
jgi:hypothetical protein